MGHWKQLKTYLQHSPVHAGKLLQKPGLLPLPDAETWDGLVASASVCGLTELLCLHHLACRVMSGGQAELAPLPDGCEAPSLMMYPDVEVRRSLVLPLPVVRGNRGKLLYCLVGLLEGGRGTRHWLHGLSMESEEVANRTWELLQKNQQEATGLFFTTLSAPDDTPLTGGSLALPLGLAIVQLKRGRLWPEGVLASGGLDRQGRILPVDGIAEKAGAMAKHQCFLVPANGSGAYGDGRLFACASLHEAVDVLEWLQAGVDLRRIRSLHAFMGDAGYILDHFAKIPLPILRSSSLGRAWETIRAHPEQYLERATSALRSVSYDPLKAGLLRNLYSGALIERLERDHPLLHGAILDLCEVLAYCANHRGAPAEAREIDRLRHRIVADEGDSTLLDTLNLRFIHERFNRYHFSPALPEELVAEIRRSEARYEGRQTPDRPLGAIYGTLCQNAAFCGTPQDEAFAQYLLAARRWFGRRYGNECKRLDAYRLYHLLERGAVEEVPPALSDYLGLQDIAGPEEWLTTITKWIGMQRGDHPFFVVLAARAMADLRVRLPLEVLQQTLDQLLRIPPGRLGHPWQLTCLNLGLLGAQHGLMDEARALLQRMIGICQTGGPTMRVMALLGASALWVLDLDCVTAQQEAASILEEIAGSTELHRPHFAGLIDTAGIGACLALIEKQKRDFFPFSYR